MSTVSVEQHGTQRVSFPPFAQASHALTMPTRPGGTLAGLPNKLRFDPVCSSSKVRRDVEL